MFFGKPIQDFPFVILGFLLMTVGASYDALASKFVRDYFANINIHQIVTFGCWTPEDAAEFSRSLFKFNNKIAYISINDQLDMEQILRVNYYKLGIFLDLDCPKSEIIFEQVSRILLQLVILRYRKRQQNYFCGRLLFNKTAGNFQEFDESHLTQFGGQRMRYNESFWWLITTNQQSVPENVFGTLPLNIATEMTVAIGHVKETYELYDVYNPSFQHGGDLNVTSMGYWNSIDGLKIALNQYKYNRRGNLRGLRLNASIALLHEPIPDFMTYISNPINRHLDTMHRFNYGLIMQLADYYNFSMNLKRGTTWGYLMPNGSHSGILGELEKGLLDISVTPFNYKKERLSVAEFTVQTWLARICLIFRHPQKNELSNVFLKPFQTDVWCYIVAVGIINWVLLYCTVKIEQYYEWREPTNTLDTNPASEIGLIAAAAICQQGLSDGPRNYSGRIVFLFLFLWALLMFQFYSASIVGSLLVEMPRYITTAQDVLDSNLEVGYERSAYNYDFFATHEDPVIKQIFQKKILADKKRKKLPSFSAEEGMMKVKKGGFAIHIDTAMAYKIIDETFDETEICELQEIYLIQPVYTSTGVAKHSPFKKMVTYGIRQIMEHGNSKRLRNIWSPKRPECPESHSSTPVPVLIEEFSPALMIILVGCGLSLFLMLLEKLVNRQISGKFSGSIEDFSDSMHI